MRVWATSLIAGALSVLALPAQQIQGSIELPASARLALRVTGDGVQIYLCSSATNGFKWTLKAPDAKLFDASGKIIGRHFAGPTWKLLDGGQVQGELIAASPRLKQTPLHGYYSEPKPEPLQAALPTSPSFGARRRTVGLLQSWVAKTQTTPAKRRRFPTLRHTLSTQRNSAQMGKSAICHVVWPSFPTLDSIRRDFHFAKQRGLSSGRKQDGHEIARMEVRRS
jgi:Protein of unknown function (DUF3455)